MTRFTRDSTMKEVETTFQYARALLHSQFHLGGCASCGFEPNETIAEVAKKHSKDESAIINALNEGYDDLLNAEIDVHDADNLLKQTDHNQILLVDVREPWEFEICRLSEKAVLLNEKNMPLIFERGQEAKHILVYCHHGVRSLNAALYMRQNGLPRAVSLKGGIDRFAQLVNTSLPRY